ncbi:alanine- and arginine-rich domain-containing protein isoform 1-T1 [Hipposideros larvatus]
MPGKLRSVVPAMGLGDSGRSREGMPRGPYGVAVRVGLGPPAPREEVPAAYTRLDDLRRRLVRAFQCAVPRGDSRRSPAAAAGEDQSPATFESALAGLRAELLEMHFQNRQLAKTLLDLNMKMQQLKQEYELEIASDSQSSEDNAVKLE